MSEANPTLMIHHQERMRHELRDAPARVPGPGEISLRIEKFGLSSNNVTYAALGRQFGYFAFFPGEGPWSALPVWGFGTVTASRAEGVAEGSRYYGYFPAAREATLAVAAASPSGFRVDRPELPPEFRLYGAYSALDGDPFYVPSQEALMVVMRPLFMTGLLLADSLAVSQRKGADAVLVSSAASKTAYGLALALRAAGGAEVIGLGSARSLSAASAFDCYDKLLDYEALDALDPARTYLLVDMAGSQKLRQQLFARLGQSLRGVVAVGLTHWNEGRLGEKSELGVPVETFFAPGWSAQRQKELGPRFQAQLTSGWLAQMESASRHFKLVEKRGSEALVDSFAALLAGRMKPEEAWVIAL